MPEPPSPKPHPNDPRDDQQLVAAANAGDHAAFEALYFRYRDWVVNLAYRTTGDRELALDVLQETFAYLWRKFPGFQLTAKMTTFLFPTVRHLAIAGRRRGQRLQPMASTDAHDPPNLTSSDAADPTRQIESPRDALARVMGNLPDIHREVVLLRFVDDLSLAEIALALDIPVGTVKSRLHHALNALREDEAVKKYFEP